MKYHEFGDQNSPHIMMIHGGGNSWWNYLRQARILSNRYHVILPTMDGHGEEYAEKYISTEDTADKIMAYIDEKCNGQLFALCGVSLGGQIVMELLSRKPDLTKKRLSMEASVIQSLLWRVAVWYLFAFLEDFYSVKKPAACR